MATGETVFKSAQKLITVGPAAESLAQPNDPTGTEWDVVGDMADGTSNVVYTHSAGSGTLTQPSAKLAVTGVNSVPYRFTYTLSSITGVANLTMTITTAFGLTAISLPIIDGLNTVDFTSAAAASSADFVISVVSTGAGGFTLDTMTLTHGSAEQIQTDRKEMLTLTLRALAGNTGTIKQVDDAFASAGIPLNAGDTAEYSAEVYDTIDIRDLFFRASVSGEGFDYTWRQ